MTPTPKRRIEEIIEELIPQNIYRKIYKEPEPERHWKSIEIPAQRIFEVDRWTLKQEFDWIGYDGEDVKNDFGAIVAIFRRKSDNRVFKIAPMRPCNVTSTMYQEDRDPYIYLCEL